MPLTAEQERDGSDLDDSDNSEDDGKSVDVFFEDISSSLIDIRKDRTSSSSGMDQLFSIHLKTFTVQRIQLGPPNVFLPITRRV